MQAAGLQATDEAREVYHQWYAPGSPANEILVGIGVNGGTSQ
jgi:hypothetical protein